MQQESIVPEKSPNDERSYEALQLPNGIKVVLVHDGKAEKGACSISVGVGSLQDGQRSLGLAHFLEHMLFMGSRKFPRHNEYSQFMSLNSGSDNAWTSDDETNYYFEIANNRFLEGVERISDFFVEALLTEGCIEKERQAVHEECQLRCGEDNSRKWEILKHFASGPYHNHSIGNNDTLTHALVGQDLREFYRREYSANRINVVLLSALPFEQVKAKAVPFLLEIENKQLAAIDYQVHFQACNLGKLVRMKSIKDEAIMQFFWVVDSFRPHRAHHPEKYITHVLGHEGKHSLLSLLKEREYASKISSYSHDLPRQSMVGLEIQLTEAGVEEYEKVYNLVIDYCSWLRADEQVYNEIKQASAVAFQFKEKSPNYSYVTELSSNMHRQPLGDVISWRAKYAPFDQTVINAFLQQLNPFNLLLVYSNSEELENPIVERYLGGNFVARDLPARVNEGIAFQPLVKNPFLPLSTAVFPPEATNSHVIREGNVFFSRGKEEVCKGGVQLIVHSQQSEVFLELYAAYLELLFKETTYEAETLRLEADYSDQDRITLSLFGFSDTVQKLLAEMCPQLTGIHRSDNAESLFELAREDLVEQYENFYMGEVDEIADVHLDILLNNTGMTIAASLEELQGYEYEKFCHLVDRFWSEAALEWVVVGNFTHDIISALRAHERAIVGPDAGKRPRQPLLCMKVQKDVVHTTKLTVEDIATSGVIKYHELGPYSERLYYTMSLLVNYIKEPFFDKLRTEKQLAYFLRAYPKNTRGVLALCFILVSSNSDPRAVSGHIATFVNEFLAKAEEDLSGEKFESIKNSVRTKVLQPHNSIKDYFDFVCREIDNKTFLFNRKDRDVLEGFLNTITREDVIGLLRQGLEKTVEVWIVAKNHEEEFGKISEEFEEFEKIKAGIEYYPEWDNRYQG